MASPRSKHTHTAKTAGASPAPLPANDPVAETLRAAKAALASGDASAMQDVAVHCFTESRSGVRELFLAGLFICSEMIVASHYTGARKALAKGAAACAREPLLRHSPKLMDLALELAEQAFVKKAYEEARKGSEIVLSSKLQSVKQRQAAMHIMDDVAASALKAGDLREAFKAAENGIVNHTWNGHRYARALEIVCQVMDRALDGAHTDLVQDCGKNLLTHSFMHTPLNDYARAVLEWVDAGRIGMHPAQPPMEVLVPNPVDQTVDPVLHQARCQEVDGFLQTYGIQGSRRPDPQTRSKPGKGRAPGEK